MYHHSAKDAILAKYVMTDEPMTEDEWRLYYETVLEQFERKRDQEEDR